MPTVRRTPTNTRIQSVSKGRSKRLTVIVYGEPSAGKTVLAGTSPGRVLIVRPPTDNTDSIFDESVKEWIVESWSDMDDVLLYLRHDGATLFEWIWLDSISLMQDQTLDDIWEMTIREKPARARWGLDKAEYGINMMRLARWVRHMKGSPGTWNFGITAHPQMLSVAEHDEAEDKLMPWIQGKNMSPRICGYANVVAYLEVRTGGTRRLHVDATDKFYAKSYQPVRDGIAPGKPRFIDNPTMPKLLSLIGGKNAVTGSVRSPRRGVRSDSGRQRQSTASESRARRTHT